MGNILEALPLGTVLKNRYQVEKVLGAGGLAITYLVREKNSGKKRVIKELFLQNALGRRPGDCQTKLQECQEAYFRQVYRNFVNEADILAGLKENRGVVPVIEV